MHRLNGVGRPRGSLLPVDETSPVGWLPPPDGAPDREVLPDSLAEAAGGAATQAGGGGRMGGVGGLTEVVCEGVADRLPAGWRAGGRVVPQRAALTAVVVALALVLGMVAHRMASNPASVTVADPETTGSARPRFAATESGTGTAAPVVGAPGAVGGSAGGATGAPATPGAGGGLVVDVEGKVRRPGLVKLGSGARVADAVAAAGGPAPGAALIRINLARPLSDGEQVVVPGPNDPLPAVGNGPGAETGSSGSGSGASGGAVDLNAATQSQLDTLPGVGPVLAGRIVAWRTEHGRFSSVDQLGEVTGIGDALLAKLRPLVRV